MPDTLLNGPGVTYKIMKGLFLTLATQQDKADLPTVIALRSTRSKEKGSEEKGPKLAQGKGSKENGPREMSKGLIINDLVASGHYICSVNVQRRHWYTEFEGPIGMGSRLINN